MRHPWSFRKHLVFSLGLALSRKRALMRRILSEHTPDDARQQLAQSVVRHLEQSGYQVDEEARALKALPPLEPHGMPRGE